MTIECFESKNSELLFKDTEGQKIIKRGFDLSFLIYNLNETFKII